MSRKNKHITLHLIGQGDNFKSNSFYIFHSNLLKDLTSLTKEENISVISQFHFLSKKEEKRFYDGFWFYFQTVYYFFLGIRRRDIVIITNPNGFYFKIFSLLKNHKILIFHDNFNIQSKIRKSKKGGFFIQLIKKADLNLRYYNPIKHYDYIAVVSNYTKESLLEDFPFLPPHRIITIGNGINNSIFKKKSYAKPCFDELFILYVGSDYERKNLVSILEVFARLKKKNPKLKLYKVGKDHSDVNRRKTLDIITKLGLTSDVVFFNEIDNEYLVDLYNHAQLLLFPSLKEGFGFPIAEAMSCACPVVTSNISPMKDIINMPELTANPHDINLLTKICQKLLANPEYNKSISNILFEKSKEHTFDNVSKRLMGIIKNFIH